MVVDILSFYSLNDLHSNMVRFIMISHEQNIIYEKDIYIPIWLDLLSDLEKAGMNRLMDLHSNMVRFIISHHTGGVPSKVLFTFQYG